MSGPNLDHIEALAQSALTGYENYEGPWGDDAPKIADTAVRLAHGVLALLEIAQAAQAATFALWESNDEERAAADALRAALARHQDTT